MSDWKEKVINEKLIKGIRALWPNWSLWHQRFQDLLWSCLEHWKKRGTKFKKLAAYKPLCLEVMRMAAWKRPVLCWFWLWISEFWWVLISWWNLISLSLLNFIYGFGYPCLWTPKVKQGKGWLAFLSDASFTRLNFLVSEGKNHKCFSTFWLIANSINMKEI